MPFVSSSNSEGCFVISDEGMIWFVVISDNDDECDDDTCESGDVLEWNEFTGDTTLCGVNGVNVLLWRKFMFVNVGVSLGVGVCVDIEWRWWDDVLIKSCFGGWGGERILITISLSLFVFAVWNCFELLLSGWVFVFVFVFLLWNLEELLSHALSSSVKLDVLRFLGWGKLLEVMSLLFKSFMKELLLLGVDGCLRGLFEKQHCYIRKEMYMNVKG